MPVYEKTYILIVQTAVYDIQVYIVRAPPPLNPTLLPPQPYNPNMPQSSPDIVGFKS